MFRWVFIEQQIPRDIKTLNVNLYEGLQGYNFFGYFFMIGAIFFLIIAILKIRVGFAFVGIFALFAIGYFMYNKAKSSYNRRFDCFKNGEAIVANVVNHSRSFNPFSSSQNYTIILKYQGETFEVAHKSEKLWAEFPINSEVIGLKYNDKYVFGPEMTVNFKFFKNN